MKNIIFLLLLLPLLCQAQTPDVPKKLLKGIDVSVDEFTGNKTFRHPLSDIYVVSSPDKVELRWELSCNGGANPVNLKAIQVLVAGSLTDIPFSETEYKSLLNPARVPKLIAGAKAGQNAYTYETVNQHFEKVDVSADQYRNLFDEMIKTGTARIKFTGDQEAIGEYKKKNLSAIKSLLAVYDFLK